MTNYEFPWALFRRDGGRRSALRESFDRERVNAMRSLRAMVRT